MNYAFLFMPCSKKSLLLIDDQWNYAGIKRVKN